MKNEDGKKNGGALQPSTRVGRYEITEFIGGGRLGDVYRAYDTNMGRVVALRCLPTEAREDGAPWERFEQVVRATGGLNHHNIVKMHDAGSAHGVRFMVTEFLHGETVRQKIESSGKVGRNLAVEIALQTAAGLAAAHGREIAHCDLRPENIVVTSSGVVKILEFGMARSFDPVFSGPEEGEVDAAGDSGSFKSRSGAIGYMAPEQIKANKVDMRSDVYSFGVVLFELLTGSNPLLKDTAIGTVAAILADEGQRLDFGSIGSGAFENVIRRCLQQDPVQRYEMARQLYEALESAKGALSVAAAGVRQDGSPPVQRPETPGTPRPRPEGEARSNDLRDKARGKEGREVAVKSGIPGLEVRPTLHSVRDEFKPRQDPKNGVGRDERGSGAERVPSGVPGEVSPDSGVWVPPDRRSMVRRESWFNVAAVGFVVIVNALVIDFVFGRVGSSVGGALQTAVGSKLTLVGATAAATYVMARSAINLAKRLILGE